MEHKIKLTIDDLELEVIEGNCANCYFDEHPCTTHDCFNLCEALRTDDDNCGLAFKQINEEL